jgi:hypothetical protein
MSASACSLNYDDLVCNNFYDMWGEFQEATSNEQACPTLSALQRLGANVQDNREVKTPSPSPKTIHILRAIHKMLPGQNGQLHRLLRLVLRRSLWCTTMMMQVCLLWMKQQLRLLVMPVPGDHQLASR